MAEFDPWKAEAVLAYMFSGALGAALAGVPIWFGMRAEIRKLAVQRQHGEADADLKVLTDLMVDVNSAAQQMSMPGAIASPINSGGMREERALRMQPLVTQLEAHRGRTALLSLELAAELAVFNEAFHRVMHGSHPTALEPQEKMVASREKLEKLVNGLAAKRRTPS